MAHHDKWMLFAYGRGSIKIMSFDTREEAEVAQVMLGEDEWCLAPPVSERTEEDWLRMERRGG